MHTSLYTINAKNDKLYRTKKKKNYSITVNKFFVTHYNLQGEAMRVIIVNFTKEN